MFLALSFVVPLLQVFIYAQKILSFFHFFAHKMIRLKVSFLIRCILYVSIFLYSYFVTTVTQKSRRPSSDSHANLFDPLYVLCLFHLFILLTYRSNGMKKNRTWWILTYFFTLVFSLIMVSCLCLSSSVVFTSHYFSLLCVFLKIYIIIDFSNFLCTEFLFFICVVPNHWNFFTFLGDDVVNEQSYRYLTIDEMKSLGDDSLPLDVTREDRYDTTAGMKFRWYYTLVVVWWCQTFSEDGK